MKCKTNTQMVYWLKAPYMETSIHLERVRGVEISRETFDLLKKKLS